MKQKLLLTLTLWLTLLGCTWAQNSNALYFDGINDYVACPAINPTNFTVVAWVCPTTLGKDQAIISTLKETPNEGMELHIGTDNIPVITVHNGSTFIDVKGTTAVTANTWTHIAATCNGSLVSIYVNGTLAKSSTASHSAGKQALVLGRRSGTSAYYFTGKMDEVSIWSQAVDPSQIAYIKQNGLAGYEMNLTAYYQFDQGTRNGSNSTVTLLTDKTANGLNGKLFDFSLTGTSSNWTTGYTPSSSETNNALHFDDINDYVSCPAINPTNFTIEAWVYPDGLNKDQAIISTVRESVNEGMELLIGADNIPMVTIHNGSSWFDVKGTTVININTWSHVAATYDGSTIKLYVNGVLEKSTTATSLNAGTQKLCIGRRSIWLSNSLCFTGKIDEVGIWSKACTLAEIAAAMGTTLTGAETGLTAYYKFNQSTAGSTNNMYTLVDATSNKLDGTLQFFAHTGLTSNWVEGYDSSPKLSIATSALNLTDQSGSSGSIEIISNTAWTINGTANWLKLSSTSGSNNGSITFTSLSANGGTTPRTATYTLIGTGAAFPITITVTQAAKSTTLSVSQNSITLPNATSQVVWVTVTSNTSWTLNGTADWLEINTASGSNNGSISFTTTSINSWAFEREAVFTLSGTDANDITITVKQAAAEAQTSITPNVVELNWQQGSTATVEMQTNEQWSVTQPGGSTFSVTPTSGQGNATLTVTALNNNIGSSDNGSYFKINDNYAVSIVQKFDAKELSISANNIWLNAEAGSFAVVEITSDTEWEFYGYNPELFTIDPVSGSGNATVIITAKKTANGYKNFTNQVYLKGETAYDVEVLIQQKSDYMPLGAGSAESPFQVSTLEHLRWMSESLDQQSPYLSSHYVLTNDIDAQATHNWQGGFMGIPHDNYKVDFNGTFNGKGYAIKNLYTTNALFISISTYSRIDSLALVNVNAEGLFATGLVQNNSGIINACYVTGQLTGSSGALLCHENGGKISNCYTAGTVNGNGNSGLVNSSMYDEAYITVSNCYTAVSAIGTNNFAFIFGDDYCDGYYNSTLCATGTGWPANNVVGLSTGQMQQQSSYNGWDFTNMWNITNGKSFPRLQGVYNYPIVMPNLTDTAKIGVVYTDTLRIIQMDYPVASVEITNAPQGMVLADSIVTWKPASAGKYEITFTITDTNGKKCNYTYSITVPLVGDGSAENPYQITTITELDYIRYIDTDKNYVLMNDLDFTGTAYAYNPQYTGNKGWEPLANNDNPFVGTFKGKGHTIKNLYINNSAENVGLFGSCVNSTIDSLGLVSVNINGANNCGALCGIIENSIVNNCYVTGTVKGVHYVGGLIGNSASTNINGSYANVTVEGNSMVGGLLGYNGKSVTNCYTAGTVIGNWYAGGLCGNNSSSITTNCYSVCYVNAISDIGGISGYHAGNTVNASYYYSQPFDNTNGFEGTALNVGQLMQQASYMDWDFENVWQITDGKTLPRLRGVQNYPVVLPVGDTAHYNTLYTHTLYAIPMDTTMASVSVSSIENMAISNGAIVWTPQTETIKHFTITASDNNGAVVNYKQYITLMPFAGNGTDDNPYQITNIDQLYKVRYYSNASFILMNNLDFADTQYGFNSQNPENKGWEPIADTINNVFSGKFNGNKCVIKNLYISKPNGRRLGLFANCQGATIDSLGLVDVNIIGDNYCGGISGQLSNSAITNCYVTGSIKGNEYIGGLAGESDNNGTIAQCYANITAEGNIRVGGLTGENYSVNVTNCYTAGSVTGKDDVGRLFGALFFSDVTNCYAVGVAKDSMYYYQLSGQHDYNNVTSSYYYLLPFADTTDSDIASLTHEQLMQQASFDGWDFENVWEIAEGQTLPRLRGLYNYPVVLPVSDTAQFNTLYTQALRVVPMGSPVMSVSINGVEGMVLNSNTITWTPANENEPTLTVTATDQNGVTTNHKQHLAVIPFEGKGTMENPYQITTITQLGWLSQNIGFWDKHYVQTANIDATNTCNWDNGNGFLPIGNEKNTFSGTYNGKGHIINGLYINRESTNFNGLFGMCYNSNIDSLGIINANISGKAYNGVLAGFAGNSVIANCYSSGNVTGDYNIGGLVGMNFNYSTVSNCYSAGNVSGRNSIGGLVGDNSFYTSVQKSYSTCNVVGAELAGGLVGYNYDKASLINGYFAGSVSGENAKGALVGHNDSYVNNCYWDTQILEQSLDFGMALGNSNTNNILGITTKAMKAAQSLTNLGDFNTVWAIREGQTYPALRSVNNAPFAFRDTLSVGANADLSRLLANDFDYETVQEHLVVRVTKLYNTGSSDYRTYFAFPEGASSGDTDSILYQVGEVIAFGDTLWGSCAKAVMVKTDNTAPVLTAVTSKTMYKNQSLALTLADVTATDADGDALNLVISDGDNYTVSGNAITPTAGYEGSLSVGIAVTDGTAISNSMTMKVTVVRSTGIDSNTKAIVKLYPNPCADYVVVESAEPLRSVSVINLMGQTVLHQDNPAGNISTAILKAGVYLVKICALNGEITILRMVKQ